MLSNVIVKRTKQAYCELMYIRLDSSIHQYWPGNAILYAMSLLSHYHPHPKLGRFSYTLQSSNYENLGQIPNCNRYYFDENSVNFWNFSFQKHYCAMKWISCRHFFLWGQLYVFYAIQKKKSSKFLWFRLSQPWWSKAFRFSNRVLIMSNCLF